MTPDMQDFCLDALTESTSEVAATVLGGMEFVRQGASVGAMHGHGAYLGLVAQEEPIQVGVLVDEAGSQALAKALLGLTPADEDLPPSDVSDAMCEVINIVAGGLKRRVATKLAITLGLPIFVNGHPLPNGQQHVVARELTIGGTPLKLLLLTHKAQATPISRSGVNTTATIAKEHSA
jgi:hypothetical protein